MGTAIKSERLLELNMKTVFDKLGINYATSEDKYKAYKAKMDKRRLLKKQMEEKMVLLTKKITKTLSEFSGVQLIEKDPSDVKLYQTLRDTFDAFDKDGSAELGYEEYLESWNFLGR